MEPVTIFSALLWLYILVFWSMGVLVLLGNWHYGHRSDGATWSVFLMLSIALVGAIVGNLGGGVPVVVEMLKEAFGGWK